MPYLLSQLLYCARWIGTLVVLAVHGQAVFINFQWHGGQDQSLLLRAARWAISYEFGHHGIVGFFVMSGFLVGGSALALLREDKPFLFDYFMHRIIRIYIVLLPAILVTIVVDALGRTMFAGVGLYEAPVMQQHYNPLLILTNVLNLQGIFAKFYGTNGPLWSVAFEFWYYLVFPLLLIPFSKIWTPRVRNVAGCLGAALFLVFTIRQIWFPIGFALWGFGILALLPKKPLMKSRLAALIVDIVVVVALRTVFEGELIARHPALEHVSDAISGLAFANLILTMRFAPDAGWAVFQPPIHRRLADFTYTVYAIHTPLLVFLGAAARKYLGDETMNAPPDTPAQWLALAGAMATIIAFGYLLSRVTEAKTGAARRKARLLWQRYHLPIDAPRPDVLHVSEPTQTKSN